MSNNRKIKVRSIIDLTINSLVRLATAVNLFIQYPHKKLESQLWCGEEVENYGGNDPVVHNDRHVKGKEEGKAEAASCFWWALTVHHQLRRRCWRKSKPSRRGNRSGLSAGGTLQYALRQLRRRGGVCQLNNDCGLENSLECTGRQAVLSKSAQSKQYLRTSRQQIVDVFSNGKTTVDGHADCRVPWSTRSLQLQVAAPSGHICSSAISWDFVRFSFKLLTSAHSSTFAISDAQDCTLAAGTTR